MRGVCAFCQTELAEQVRHKYEKLAIMCRVLGLELSIRDVRTRVMRAEQMLSAYMTANWIYMRPVTHLPFLVAYACWLVLKKKHKHVGVVCFSRKERRVMRKYLDTIIRSEPSTTHNMLQRGVMPVCAPMFSNKRDNASLSVLSHYQMFCGTWKVYM